MLGKYAIWRTIGRSRSTYHEQADGQILITADMLRRPSANLSIKRAELLSRHRLIDPAKVTSLAAQIAEPHHISLAGY